MLYMSGRCLRSRISDAVDGAALQRTFALWKKMARLREIHRQSIYIVHACVCYTYLGSAFALESSRMVGDEALQCEVLL